MINLNLIKRILTLSILISILIPVDLFSQFQTDPVRIIPKSPESASFDQYMKVPVSLATGVPKISIPLYTIHLEGIDIPISISYHASGVKVDDIATPVGLNWVLNAGGRVSRTIYGIEDAESNGWIGTTVSNPDSCIDRDDLIEYYSQEHDLAPDIYTYNFPGAAGSFFYTTGGEILKTTIDDIIFKDSINIYDAQGNYFKFKEGETSYTTVTNDCDEMTINCVNFSGGDFTTWHLEKIITPTQDTVLFTYTSHSYSTPNIVTRYDYVRSEPNPNYGSGVDTDTLKTWTTTTFGTKLISLIETSKEKVEFFYALDNNASIMKKRLYKITVTDVYNDEIRKIIKFSHGHYSGDPRLRLDTLKVSGNDTTKYLTYRLSYQSGSLPTYGSYKRDVFGFHNNNAKYHMIPRDQWADTIYFSPSYFADRDIDTAKLMYGILTEVTYPTGGSIKYTYEANKEYINNSNYFAPGLRIKQIEYIDVNNNTIKKELFTYSGLTSDRKHKEGIFINYYFERDFDDVTPSPLYSEMKWSSIALPTAEFIKKEYNGFYYGAVTRETTDGTTNAGYTKSTFNGYYDNFNLSPYLVEETIYDENDKQIRRAEHTYSNDTSRVQALGLDLSYTFWGLYIDCDGNTSIVSGVDSASLKQYYNNLQKLYYTSSEFKKNSSTITEYYNNESDSIVTKNKDYYDIETYENSDCLFMIGNSRYSIVAGDSVLLDSTAIKYAKDYIEIDFAEELEDSLITGKPIDIRQYKLYNSSRLLTGGKTTEYDKYGNPIKEYIWKGTSPSSETWSGTELVSTSGGFNERISYDYDSLTHKLKSSTLKDNITTTYIWGYGNNYPIAKVENAAPSEVYYTSFEDAEGILNQGEIITGLRVNTLSAAYTTQDSLIEGDYILSYFWRSTVYSDWELQIETKQIGTGGGKVTTNKTSGHIDELRVLPKDAVMTTFTYHPLIGITSTTDQNNITTYYEYDSFGRLEFIKDNDGNILKAHNYNYINQ